MKKIAFFCLCVGLLAFFCACKSKTATETFFAMDTVITLTINGDDAEGVLKKAKEKVFAIEKEISRTLPDSPVYALNHEKTAHLPESLYHLLSRCQNYYALSGGVFDITIGGVTALWDFHAKDPALPKSADISAMLKTVDIGNLELIDNSTAALINDANIDLGGVGKGYAAAVLRDFLLENGISSALINLGGNVYALGTKLDGQPWRVGVQKPFGETADISAILNISDLALVTSGTYERQFTYKGVLYHHILNPKTGYPIKTDVAGVTILCQDAELADVLSTTCLLLGLDKAKALIEGLDGAEALFIKTDGESVMTDGMKNYIVE